MLRNSSAVSYTISAVIMTAVTLTLVLVASSYTYQALEQQRGATEFDAAKKSILAFDDALRDAAWKPEATRSARFTVNYGQLELIPNVPLVVNVTGYQNASLSLSREVLTGYISYKTKTTYISFEEGSSTYFLGSSRTLADGAASYGRASIEQNAGWVNMVLNYGVRAMKTSTISVTQGNQTVRVNNVDIWITRINITNWSTYVGEFDLRVHTLAVATESFAGDDGNGYSLGAEKQCNISVGLGSNPLDTTSIDLDGDKVALNFVIATLQVTV